MSEYDRLKGDGERWAAAEDDAPAEGNSTEERLKRLEVNLYAVGLTQELLLRELRRSGVITDESAERIEKLVKDLTVNHFARPKTQN